MKDNKTWYEKVGIWIGIIASTCAILGISVFSGKSLIKDSETDNKSVNIDDSTISVGDQSAIMIGDNNTFNYFGGSDDDKNFVTPESTPEQTPKPTPTPTPEPTPVPTSVSTAEPTPTPDTSVFTVSVSHDVNPIQVSPSGIDLFVMAHTSYPATSVTISSSTDSRSYGPYNMYRGTDGWWFNANFYEKGTFTVVITAYASDGQTATDSFEYIYE